MQKGWGGGEWLRYIVFCISQQGASCPSEKTQRRWGGKQERQGSVGPGQWKGLGLHTEQIAWVEFPQELLFPHPILPPEDRLRNSWPIWLLSHFASLGGGHDPLAPKAS